MAATERAYKEQRFIGASVDSFGSLHAHVTGFLVGTWAVVCGVAGVFLVDWGVDLQQWVMPFSSTVLSAALVCGWLPYETISGAGACAGLPALLRWHLRFAALPLPSSLPRARSRRCARARHSSYAYS